MTIRIAVLPLARPTFDVPYAEEMARAAFATLDRGGVAVVGSRTLLFDAAATEAALAALEGERVDLVLVLQVTFTDATMTVRIAESVGAPLAIWAFPEPRAGGRLRLNAFCGLNLAQHALGRAGHSARWIYTAPDDTAAAVALHEFVQDAAQKRATPASRVPARHTLRRAFRCAPRGPVRRERRASGSGPDEHAGQDDRPDR